MASDPVVTIAIPTLEAGAPLAACLRSLNSQIFREFEVTVINNGTHACSAPPDLFFPCRFLSPGENVGFGAAINMVARTTTAPFIATLNDDTEPDPKWLDALVREISTNPRIGMCASRIRLFESGQLDSAGMLICLDGSSKQRGRGKPPSTFDCSEDVLLPSGCAALYRRQMLEEVGFFDEDYFLYCEDTDLGLRGRWAGWSCRYAPGATLRHHYSVTAGAFSPLKARFVERNRLWVAVKNFPVALLALAPLISILRYSWQFASLGSGRGAAFEYVRSGNSLRSALAILAGAHGETLRLLPSLLRKRAAIRRTRRIGSLTFLKLLFRHRITARGACPILMEVRLLVIVPALNEEAAVGDVVRSIKKVVPDVPVLVIDDHSSDLTAAVAERAGATVVRLPVHLGLGGCVQTGYKLAYELGYDYVIRVDGDGQHEAADIPKIYDALIATGAEVVIGSRFLEPGGQHTSTPRSIGIAFFRLLLKPILGKTIHDPTSGFVGVNRRALQVFSTIFPLDYPEIEALVVLQRKRFHFHEVACRMYPRRSGKSTIRLMTSFRYMLHVLLGVFVNVLRFDGSPRDQPSGKDQQAAK